MAIEPATISARPATTTSLLVATAVPVSPAASANGTVSPSDIPMTTSRTVSEASKCFSACSVWGDLGINSTSSHACGAAYADPPPLSLQTGTVRAGFFQQVDYPLHET